MVSPHTGTGQAHMLIHTTNPTHTYEKKKRNAKKVPNLFICLPFTVPSALWYAHELYRKSKTHQSVHIIGVTHKYIVRIEGGTRVNNQTKTLSDINIKHKEIQSVKL